MQQTKTTMRLKMPTLPRNLDLPAPVAIAVVIFALLGIVGAIGRITSAPAVAVQPTPGLIILIATPRAEPVPLVAPAPVQQVAAAPVGNVTRRAIVVYGSADMTSAIGAVEPGRAFTPVAHYGSEWMVVDMDGSGRVYVRIADLYDLPAGLLDLKPAPAPEVVIQPVYVGQPAAPQAPAVEQPHQTMSGPAQPPEQPAPQAQPAAAPIVAPAPAPQVAPTRAPMQDDEVTQEWARQQLRAERCIANKCRP